MKKDPVQDIIPPKKSIRNIEIRPKERRVIDDAPAPKKSRINIRKEVVVKEEPVDEPIRIETPRPAATPTPPPRPPIASIPSYKYEYEEPKKKSKKWLYAAFTVLALVLAFGISSFFKSAQVTITPKQDTKNLNATFTAKNEVSQNSLGFQVVTVTKDVEKMLDPSQATSQQTVSEKATGKIVIYNNYSSEPQKLVATTRFETPEGLVYRITNGVTIPGQTTKNGAVTAGSIETTVMADKAGPDYNIGLKDFTLPGLKGDPKYTKVYARSKTAMSGGFSGVKQVVSKDVMAQTETQMTSSLKDSLSKDITAQIPANFVLFPASIVYNLDPVAQSTDTNSTSAPVLKKTGQATAVIFDKVMLTRVILAQILPQTDSSMVKIVNLGGLTFSYQTASSSIGSSSSSITFNLSGQASVVWMFDENKLKADLLGLSKQNAKTVIGSYPGIEEAWVVTRPFWNQTIPQDTKKVTLVNTIPN